MPPLPAHLPAGVMRERRAIGGDPAAGPVAGRHSRCESPEKRPDVLVGGSVLQDVIEAPLVAAMLNCRQHAAGAIIHVIGSDRARKIRQGPGKAGRVQARLRLFFPPPRPSAAWSQRAQRRAGRAPGASAPDGRAHRLRPRCGPPDRSPDGSTAGLGAPDRSGPRERPCGTAYSSAAHTCPREPADTRGRDAPSQAASAGSACPARPGDHNADTRGAWRCDWQGRSLAVGRRPSRASLRWDRVDTPPARTWRCPPCSHVRATTL